MSKKKKRNKEKPNRAEKIASITVALLTALAAVLQTLADVIEAIAHLIEASK